MFARRPRSYLPTVMFILVTGGIIYVLYLNNNLQVKLKALDEKNKRYHDQHQSLSSQLQVVYEDRSRLENSLQKEKYEHQNAKDELQLQKEVHENAMQDAISKHKKEVESLKDQHEKHKVRLAETMKDLDDSQSLYNKLLVEKETHRQLAEKHVEDKEKLENQNNDLTEELVRLRSKIDDGVQAHEKLKTVARQYEHLKNIMKNIGSDVLILDHEHFEKLSDTDRRFLFGLFGGTADHGTQLELQRIQLKQERWNRQEAVSRQQRLRDDRNRQLAAVQNASDEKQSKQGQDNQAQNQQQPALVQTKNICHLPPVPGTCHNNYKLFYFDPQLSSCREFTFTGCGGNPNRFPSLQSCEEFCLGNNRLGNQSPGIEKDQVVDPVKVIQPQDANQPRDTQPVVGNVKSNVQSEDADQNEPQEQSIFQPENDRNPKAGPNPKVDENFDPSQNIGKTNDNVPLVADNDTNRQEVNAAEKENSRNAIAVEEERAQEDERNAREELQNIENHRRDPPQVEDEDGEEVDPNKAIEQLGEMHKKQQQLAKEKEEQLAMLAALKAGKQKMEGTIEYENAKDGPLKVNKEVNNQMIEPPGAARVPAEDKPVIDQPALEINKGDHVEDDQPQDDYENDNKDSDAGDEGDEEEEEEGLNEAQADKEGYDLAEEGAKRDSENRIL